MFMLNICSHMIETGYKRIVIDPEARKIIGVVASVRPSIRPFVLKIGCGPPY